MSGVPHWSITSTDFSKTLSYLIQIYVYIMRRQDDAVVTVFNTYSMSNSPIHDPEVGTNIPTNGHVMDGG